MRLMFWLPRKPSKAELRFKLVNAEAAVQRLTEQVAELAAERVVLLDEKRRVYADLSDARDNERAARKARDRARQETAEVIADRERLRADVQRLERQAQLDRRTNEDLERDLNEAVVTAEGLGLEMARLQREAAGRGEVGS